PKPQNPIRTLIIINDYHKMNRQDSMNYFQHTAHL
ncbi:MAG: hypothetical protein ACI9QD_001059, partial [Thermoproteota archaeon]